MWRRIRQLSGMALLSVSFGCQHPKPLTNTKPPPDPLLMSKKPIEGRPTSYGTTSTSWRQPEAPDSPVRDAVVQQPNLGRPVVVGYSPPEDTGVSIGKPR